MRIDAHHHLWDLAVRDQPWTAALPALRRSFSLADLRPSLAVAGIDGTVLVQTVGVPEETPEFLQVAADHDEVLGVVGWVDLTSPEVGDRLAELQQLPGGDRLVGIRHGVQSEPDADWLARPDVIRGLRQVADHQLAYDLLIYPHQFPAAIEAVSAVPELRFVLDHGGKPRIATRELDSWTAQLVQLAERPNVAVKLSGLITEADHEHWTVADIAPYVKAMILAFGADRVMFGSDWPVCNLAGDYQTVVDLASELTMNLSVEEQQMIFGDTAERWYRIGDQG